MIETALVFDADGVPLHWHLPAGRSAVSIPDSRALWEVLWAARERLGGVAHTHPGAGPALPSDVDVTTFAACEAGLGRRLQWVIATDDEVAQFEWADGYRRVDNLAISVEQIERLRQLSRMGQGE